MLSYSSDSLGHLNINAQPYQNYEKHIESMIYIFPPLGYKGRVIIRVVDKTTFDNIISARSASNLLNKINC